ncbi:(4Fe-4S)-binding protein, partial [Kitasatospora sp. NPDC058190]
AKRGPGGQPPREAVRLKAAPTVPGTPALLGAAQRAASLGGRALARGGRIGRLPGPLSGWSADRDTPVPPAESFRAWWRRNREGK